MNRIFWRVLVCLVLAAGNVAWAGEHRPCHDAAMGETHPADPPASPSTRSTADESAPASHDCCGPACRCAAVVSIVPQVEPWISERPTMRTVWRLAPDSRYLSVALATPLRPPIG